MTAYTYRTGRSLRSPVVTVVATNRDEAKAEIVKQTGADVLLFVKAVVVGS